jgi:hypothetical protein
MLIAKSMAAPSLLSGKKPLSLAPMLPGAPRQLRLFHS